MHIFRAKDQPATRFLDDALGSRHWTTHPGNRLLRADCCKKQRPAKNLVVQVYYDCLRFSCRAGKGCKHAR